MADIVVDKPVGVRGWAVKSMIDIELKLTLIDAKHRIRAQCVCVSTNDNGQPDGLPGRAANDCFINWFILMQRVTAGLS